MSSYSSLSSSFRLSRSLTIAPSTPVSLSDRVAPGSPAHTCDTDSSRRANGLISSLRRRCRPSRKASKRGLPSQQQHRDQGLRIPSRRPTASQPPGWSAASPDPASAAARAAGASHYAHDALAHRAAAGFLCVVHHLASRSSARPPWPRTGPWQAAGPVRHQPGPAHAGPPPTRARRRQGRKQKVADPGSFNLRITHREWGLDVALPSNPRHTTASCSKRLDIPLCRGFAPGPSRNRPFEQLRGLAVGAQRPVPVCPPPVPESTQANSVAARRRGASVPVAQHA